LKKLLYITANPKPENLSASKSVGRQLVNSILKKNTEYMPEEVDLYEDHIPQLKHIYYESRNQLISDDNIEKLDPHDQKEVMRIKALCDQFVSADLYVLAAPMWSLSFPDPVKEYLDCVIQANKTIKFENDKPYGILIEKPRTFIYVQSSGGSIPWIIRSTLNKGLNYIEDMIKFIGISQFEELLVDGTGTNETEEQEAISKAKAKIDKLIDKINL